MPRTLESPSRCSTTALFHPQSRRRWRSGSRVAARSDATTSTYLPEPTRSTARPPTGSTEGNSTAAPTRRRSPRTTGSRPRASWNCREAGRKVSATTPPPRCPINQSSRPRSPRNARLAREDVHALTATHARGEDSADQPARKGTCVVRRSQTNVSRSQNVASQVRRRGTSCRVDFIDRGKPDAPICCGLMDSIRGSIAQFGNRHRPHFPYAAIKTTIVNETRPHREASPREVRGHS